jgi:regulator of protease activity HflC (stomatin/prohibitin superfamily)
MRIVTMPIESQGIITRYNVSVDVPAVAYFRVIDATKSVVAIEYVYSPINQITPTTLRKVGGQHTHSTRCVAAHLLAVEAHIASTVMRRAMSTTNRPLQGDRNAPRAARTWNGGAEVPKQPERTGIIA